MDGYETSRFIRNHLTKAKNIPIIAMTANALTGERDKCLEAGMDEYVTKPLNADKLIQKIAELLNIN